MPTRLAVQGLDKHRLVIGGNKIRFVRRSEDDQADPTQHLAAAQLAYMHRQQQ